MTGGGWGESFSTNEISRASARGSPPRARSMASSGLATASGRPAARGGELRSVTLTRHPQQQRAALATAPAERSRAQAAPAPTQFVHRSEEHTSELQSLR